MKILHLMRQDTGGTGGAFGVAIDIHKGMKKAGVQSRIGVAEKNSRNDDVIQIYTSTHRWQRTIRRRLFYYTVGRRIKKTSWFNVDIDFAGLSASRILSAVGEKPDFIFVHFAADFLTPQLLYELHRLTRAPVVWILVDLMPLTGGCHYAFDCRKYETECSACPLLHSTKRKDWAFFNWQQRLRYFEKMDLTIVTCCSWLTQIAQQSRLVANKPIFQIMLPVDPELYKPGDKDLARQKLGLPLDKTILYFGAHSLTDPRKGVRHVLDALLILFEDEKLRHQLFVTFAGRNGEELEMDLELPFKNLGFLKGRRDVATAYQACDIFISPSIQDAGPLMVNQAIMSGTPVVAFDVGVAQDLVISGKTGYRAIPESSQDLAMGIKRICKMSKREYNKLEKNCRKLALELCHPQKQTQAYLDILKC